MIAAYNSTHVAKILGVGRTEVGRLARTRKLGFKIGRDWIFTVQDIEAMRVRIPGRPPKRR